LDSRLALQEVTMRTTRTIRALLFIVLLLSLAVLEGWQARAPQAPLLLADPVCTHGYAPYGCYPVPTRGSDFGWLERL